MRGNDRTPTHDDLIKNLLLQPRLFRDFCRAFLPALSDFADLNHLDYIDKEHPGSRRSPRRSGDILIKSRQHNKDVAFLIHIESQSSTHPAMIERTGEYALRDSIRYHLPVLPMLLLTGSIPKNLRPPQLNWVFGKVATFRIKCPVIQFQRLNPEPLLRSRNVAALALSALTPLSPAQQVTAIVETLAESLRQKLPHDEFEAATEFVRHYLSLEDSLALQVASKVATIAKNEPALAAMPKLVNPFIHAGRVQGRIEGLEIGREEGLEKGLEQGREEGLEKGRLEGTRQFALHLMHRKFPSIPKTAASLLRRLDEPQLLDFGDALITLDSPSACLAWLRQARR